MPFTQTLAQATSAGSIALSLWFFGCRSSRGTGEFIADQLRDDLARHHVRHHVLELTKAWLLLAAFYTLVWVLESVHPFSRILTGRYQHAAQFALDFGTIIVCTATNILVIRAIVHLETPPRVTADRSERVTSFTAGTLRLQHILSGLAVFTSSYIIFVYISGNSTNFWWRLLPHALQLLLSACLLLWLTLVYHRLRGHPFLCVGVAGYALLQLGYPLLGLHDSPYYSSHYVWAFICGKFAFGCAVLFLVGTLVLPTVHLNDIPTVVASFAHRRMQLFHLHRTANHLLYYLVCVGLLALTGGIIKTGPIPSSLSTEESAFVAAGVLAYVILVYLILQGAFYFLILMRAFREPWEKFASFELSRVVNYESRQQAGNNWRHEILSRPPEEDQSEPARDGSTVLPPNRGLVEVVLLHGFGTQADRAFALLPLFFVLDERVARVHLLPYRHSLYSTANWYEDLPNGLRNNLQWIHGSGRRIVLFAHSLGALLVMKAMQYDPEESRLVARVGHLVSIGAPLRGSRCAWLGWPWGIYRVAAPRAKFVASAFTYLKTTLLRLDPGFVTHDETCTVSLYCGSQDTVSGEVAGAIRSDVLRLMAEVHGSLVSVYDRDGNMGRRLLAELDCPSRDCARLQRIGRFVLSHRRAKCGWLIEEPREGAIAIARVLQRLEHDAERPDAILWFGARETFENALKAEYELAYQAENGREDVAGGAWDGWWRHFCRFYSLYRDGQPLVWAPGWPGESTMYMVRAGSFGFAWIANERRMDEYWRQAATFG